MQWSLEAQESHVAVMEHGVGVLRPLCVSVNAAMKQIGRLQGAMPVQLITGQPVQCACSVLPILQQPRELLVPVPVKLATSETMKLHQKRENMKTLLMKISPTDAQNRLVLQVMLLSQLTRVYTVEWSAPQTLVGGQQISTIRWKSSDPDNLGSYIGTVYVPGFTEMRIFTGLRPCTDYCVRVTAENGVSDQTPLVRQQD
ncbi:hypothetical protein GBAR_LOCUS12556 [Geodia barretti]|uniref:Fibronectin type-III domain-containing protein n=1 Tax=Geodia barretti TaxID=519541 RepID=A0AA35S1B0_GEOBA|nr:hypothetical protein GBAR_LOCUS12556 [Geodia barretti]